MGFSNMDSIWTGRLGVRTPVGARYSASVQTGSKAQAASCKRGTGVFFPGVSSLGLGVDHPPPFSAKVKERVELYI